MSVLPKPTPEKHCSYHKDKNWKNNNPDNLQVLCASCHNSDADVFKQRIMQKTGKPVIIAQRGVTVDVSKEPY